MLIANSHHDFRERFRKEMLVVAQAVREETPLATKRTQTNRDDVDEHGGRAYGKSENEQKQCYWMARSYRLLNSQSHPSPSRCISLAQSTYNWITSCAKASLKQTAAQPGHLHTRVTPRSTFKMFHAPSQTAKDIPAAPKKMVRFAVL